MGERWPKSKPPVALAAPQAAGSGGGKQSTSSYHNPDRPVKFNSDLSLTVDALTVLMDGRHGRDPRLRDIKRAVEGWIPNAN